MRTLKDSFCVGVFGKIWAKDTCRIIAGSRICDNVSLFTYTEREALFIDQYDFFIITDFGRQLFFDSEQERIIKLNQMREIIASRSMRTVMFANNDDVDVSRSLREAGCRLIRLNNIQWNRIPEIFANTLLSELCRENSAFQDGHHQVPLSALRGAVA